MKWEKHKINYVSWTSIGLTFWVTRDSYRPDSEYNAIVSLGTKRVFHKKVVDFESGKKACEEWLPAFAIEIEKLMNTPDELQVVTDEDK